uniref:5'-3' exoribonuclease n=1 Tax=Tetraselmis sp. GSL018 TaxID=582737 RepID=A0A061S5C0_9CHLO|mmetsp:Transcript_26715/g.63343  ORF Transcript_26715/g.63343 Transcript_26715/m.63343 type:complete len:1047 (+) Transcript_26715:428-3568(+)
MGVPAFYRWLSVKYPKIVVDVIEEQPQEVNGVKIPVDTSQPNPQGIEFDNLYLDMNGIIHPCFHPEDRPAPSTETEVFDNIFDYIDRLFGMIRPRKLLYMAIDGVAPRAKMNQQRSRRFRAAQEAEEKEREEEDLRQEYAKQGIHIPKKEKSEVCDSNTITPGTPFMHRLAIALQYYVHLRLNNDPGWKDVKVILSDSNSPGEGEHKIMEYIRQQRNRPGTDPNTKHVVYGLDADLIMLGLATHEPHFYILREVVLPQQQPSDTPAFKINANGEAVEEEKPEVVQKPFQLLLVAVLREYLQLEFKVDNLPFERDPEREFDDFVFMCFFVGNDFLPHSPSLEIREGAIELLMQKYKEMLPDLGGYLTFGGEVDLEKVEKFIERVSQAEEAIFARRGRMLQGQKRRAERNKQMNAMKKQQSMHTAQGMEEVAPTARGPSDAYRHKTIMLQPAAQGPQSNRGAAAELKSKLAGSKRPPEHGVESAAFKAPRTEGSESVHSKQGSAGDAEDGVEASEEQKAANKKAAQEFKEKMEENMKEKSDMFDTMVESEKKIRLGEPGWRERYYQEKLKTPPEQQEELIRDMVKHYIEGVCWVMRYYYDGVASWDWYYPYHYAPFASDLRNLSGIKIKFELGKPFKPFNQLMGVLPAASAHALPEPFQWLFTDPESPLIDFYPKDFQIDINGKRFAWQAVVLLPFIDEQRLLEVTEPLEEKLTDEEKFRNSNRLEQLYIGPSHALVPFVLELQDCCASVAEEKRLEHKQVLDTEASGGMAGFIALGSGDPCPMTMPAPFSLGDDITANGVMCVTYLNPEPQRHEPKLQEGTILPEPKVDESDVGPPKTLWHEDLPNHLKRSGNPQDHNHNNRPQMLADAAHRYLQRSLGTAVRGGYNPYTGGYSRGVISQGPPPGLQPGGFQNQGPSWQHPHGGPPMYTRPGFEPPGFGGRPVIGGPGRPPNFPVQPFADPGAPLPYGGPPQGPFQMPPFPVDGRGPPPGQPYMQPPHPHAMAPPRGPPLHQRQPGPPGNPYALLQRPPGPGRGYGSHRDPGHGRRY